MLIELHNKHYKIHSNIKQFFTLRQTLIQTIFINFIKKILTTHTKKHIQTFFIYIYIYMHKHFICNSNAVAFQRKFFIFS